MRSISLALGLLMGVALGSIFSAHALSWVYNSPAACLRGDQYCLVIDENQSPNLSPQLLLRDERGDFYALGAVCPLNARNVANNFVLGTDPNGWSGPTLEGDVLVYTYHGQHPTVAVVDTGRLDTGRGTVTKDTGPVYFQDGAWRCLSKGNTNIPLPTPPAVTKPLTIGEVQAWCSNCAGTFEIIEGGNAISYTAANTNTCPAGFDMPIPVSFQAATVNGYQEGQAESQTLITRVCKATFRLYAIRI